LDRLRAPGDSGAAAFYGDPVAGAYPIVPQNPLKPVALGADQNSVEGGSVMGARAKPAILISNLETLAFETAETPMWVYDVKSLAFLAVNDAAVRLYGYSRDQFLAMTILDIRPAEDVIAILRETLSAARHNSECMRSIITRASMAPAIRRD
jgi:PAS domain-containing protein